MKTNKIYIAIFVLATFILAGLIWMGTYSFSPVKWTSVNEEDGLSTVSEALEDDKIIVGFSQVGSESVWRTVNTESIQNALSQENGFFLLTENGRQRQENQLKSIRNFISQRVDYIIFSPIVQSGWKSVLNEAKEAGIPVIVVDRNVDKSTRDSTTVWVGTDAEAEGKKAGEWLENYLTSIGKDRDEINIMVLKGTIGSTAQLGRSMGFDKVAEKHNNWNIVAQEEGEFTTSLGKERMENVLNNNPDLNIDVLVSQNDDMTFGAIEALKNHGINPGIDGDIIIISFDATKEALKLVSSGEISVDIECNPLQGDLVKEIIEKLEAGESVEPQIYVDEMIFTQDNVDEYLDSRVY